MQVVKLTLLHENVIRMPPLFNLPSIANTSHTAIFIVTYELVGHKKGFKMMIRMRYLFVHLL